MPQISVDLDVLRDALLDRSLSQVGDDAVFKTKVSFADAPLSPATQLAVRVLNRAEDKDDDAVFESGATPPHIAFDLQSAWIKYKLSAKVAAAANIGIASAKAGGDIVLADYRKHPATDRAFASMVDDLDSPRSLLSLDDVKKLAPGEALAMEIGGSLSTSVTLSWSGILGTKLPELLADLPERLPIAIKLKSGLSATASISVTDQFSVVISRTLDSHYRIAVKKAKSNDHSFGIELEAGLDVSAVQEIEDALAPAFAELIEAADGRDAIIEGINAAKSKLNTKLNALFRWKAMAGFAYEYARIDESTSIADYILLDDSKIADDYDRAINGRWADIANTLRQDLTARTLVRYLNETTLTQRTTSGFSLGIGKWLQVKAQDQSTFSQSTRTSLDGFQLITSKGTRRYDEKNIPQNDFEWTVDLKAQMKEFRSAPTSLDFAYGLQYAVMLDRGAISQNDVDRMLDFAAMWDVCVPDSSMFAGAIGQKGTLRVQMLFEREQLEATLHAFGRVAAWAEPLATAMPYMNNFAERRTFDARASVYTDAWTAALSGASYSNADWAALLRRSIRSGLILLEQRALPGSFAWTAGDGHPQWRSRLSAFMRGAAMLHTAMTTAATPQSVGDAYALLEDFWSQRLYIAASGRYLLARARDAGITPNVTLQVEFADQSITS
jgi:hypothetical protein